MTARTSAQPAPVTTASHRPPTASMTAPSVASSRVGHSFSSADRMFCGVDMTVVRVSLFFDLTMAANRHAGHGVKASIAVGGHCIPSPRDEL